MIGLPIKRTCFCVLHLISTFPNHIVMQFLLVQALDQGVCKVNHYKPWTRGYAKSIVRVYEAAFEEATIFLEVWMCRWAWPCADGANFMVRVRVIELLEPVLVL